MICIFDIFFKICIIIPGIIDIQMEIFFKTEQPYCRNNLRQNHLTSSASQDSFSEKFQKIPIKTFSVFVKLFVKLQAFFLEPYERNAATANVFIGNYVLLRKLFFRASQNSYFFFIHFLCGKSLFPAM